MTAEQLLTECGQMIRRLVAGLSMPDWPEGARRAISVSIGPIVGIDSTGVRTARDDHGAAYVKQTDWHSKPKETEREPDSSEL